MPQRAAPGLAVPGAAMCSVSEDRGEVSNWCGTGWTGEPAVFERDGRTWLVFGAYDRAVHFVDAATGEDILPPFPTGDLIKGSVTIDPHGFPLVYVGSRDGLFRVLAFDRPQATELWRLSANEVSPTKWNDDWDGSSLVLGDYLFEGGENSQMHVVKLNRGRAPDGTVTVAPSLVWNAPGWDDQLLAEADNEVSIENSVAISGDTLYFANSGGLVQGWDISGLRTGTGPPQRVFRFWTGEDTDASVVVDEQGMLYVGSEWEKHRPHAADVGQMMKLDPHRADNPLVWSQKDEGAGKSGVWGTPGVFGDLVIFTTYSGRAVGIDRTTGVGPLGEAAAGAADGIAVDRRRDLAPGRLRRRSPRLRRAQHDRRPARAVAGAAGQLHRVDPGGVERAGSTSGPAAGSSTASATGRRRLPWSKACAGTIPVAVTPRPHNGCMSIRTRDPRRHRRPRGARRRLPLAVVAQQPATTRPGCWRGCVTLNEAQLRRQHDRAAADLARRAAGGRAAWSQPMRELASARSAISLRAARGQPRGRRTARLSPAGPVAAREPGAAPTVHTTGNLVTALRNPQARGRWGEMQLRRVVVMAGMLHANANYRRAVDADRRGRSASARLHRPSSPGRRRSYVDVKLALDTYLAAVEDDGRRQCNAPDCVQRRPPGALARRQARGEVLLGAVPRRHPTSSCCSCPATQLLACVLEH